MSREYLFKIGLLGCGRVGKSALVQRALGRDVCPNYRMTIGADFALRRVAVDGAEVTFQIWDPAGQEQYKFRQETIFRGLNGVFYVYDLNFPVTLFNLRAWVVKNQKLNQNYGSCVELVVGNKMDLLGGMHESQMQVYWSHFVRQVPGANFLDCLYTSALTGQGVNDALAQMAHILVNQGS